MNDHDTRLADAGRAADRDFTDDEADASTSRCARDEPAVSTQPLEWIEIRLVGDGDVPVAGERYRVTLPDGRVVEGRLGPDGIARIAGIPGGRCTVGFPRMDESAWDSAS